MSFQVVYELVKQTGNEWLEDKAARLGAALAFYSVFSLAPLVLLTIALCGFVFGAEAARGQIVDQIKGIVGVTGAQAIEDMLVHSSQSDAGWVATLLGVATLLFGASGVFGQLQDALNTVWEVAPKPGRGVLGVLQDRFLSFTMVLGTGFLLLVSLILTTVLEAVVRYVASGWLPGGPFLLQAVNALVSFGLITLLFAMIYKVLPDVQLAWSDVWIGAAVTAALFTLGKYLIGLYLAHATVASTYGAAGSLVVLLLWVYYSAQILLFGAEFTQVYANQFGSHVRPAANAVAVTEQARAQEGMPRTRAVEAAARGS